MKIFPKGIGVSKLLWVLLLLLLWELIARSGKVSPQLMPDLGTILTALWHEIFSGELFPGIYRSILFVIFGIISGTILAGLFSTPALFHPQIRNLMDVLTAVLHPLPGIALLPIFILFFGIGTTPLIMIIIHSVLWPLCINIRGGFENIPDIYLKIGRNYQLSPIHFFIRIMVPAAFPQILAGLRIAWARSWRALISAEMLFGVASGNGGLGWYIYNKRLFMDTPGMYAGLLVLVMIGLLVETILFKKLEERTTRRWSLRS
ncbi:MAG: ABC transporter permease [Spirochaetales bacterium]|nr:ABC transporter permease [Spirochaetales bacterium]